MSESPSRFRDELKHYVLASLVLASAFLLLEQRYHLLGWLDSIMLSVAQNVLFDRVPFSPSAAAVADAERPVLVLLGDRLYEDRFLQQSPLHRGKLRSMLCQIIEHNPKLLVIDLDLSPGTADRGPSEGGQQPLGQADPCQEPEQKKLDLKAPRKDGQKPSGQTNPCQEKPDPKGSDPKKLQDALDCVLKQTTQPIVTITPFPVSTIDLIKKKHQWMGEMCAAGVRFGLPDIIQTYGVVLKESSEPGRLAGVAYEPETSPAPCEQVGNRPPDQVPFLTPFARPTKIEGDRLNFNYWS